MRSTRSAKHDVILNCGEAAARTVRRREPSMPWREAWMHAARKVPTTTLSAHGFVRSLKGLAPFSGWQPLS